MTWLGRILGQGTPERPAPAGDSARLAEVEAVLERIRPLIAADGGDIELLGVEDGWVHLRLSGACSHCHASPMTVQGLVEPELRRGCDWVRGVRLR